MGNPRDFAIMSGNAGQRDPRAVSRPAYAPRLASDLQAQSEIEAELARAQPTDVEYWMRRGGRQFQYRPLPITEALWPGLITGKGIANAILLVPKNPARIALKISNPGKNGGGISGGDVSFSYNSPVNLGNGAASGIVLPMGGPSYQEQNGVISTDAIYCWTDDPFGAIPIGVCAYEGVYLGGS